MTNEATSRRLSADEEDRLRRAFLQYNESFESLANRFSISRADVIRLVRNHAP